jgi:ABC-type nitrate/sulfonate/bicarbonate transport system substrate-binding protein
MTFRNLIAAAVGLLLSVATAVAQSPSVLKVGFAKCAHCMPMALLPDFAKDVKLEIVSFNAGSDVLTALVSKSIDVGQVTYLHFVTALDKGFDVVAISGQVNGGSELLVSPTLDMKAGDWVGLKALVTKNKADGKPLKLGASRGSAQDIHMRGALFKHGIDVNRDVQFVNIPNPADHLAAIRRGEIDMICAVEPFATQIRRADAAKHFALPYDQAAGRLTNIVVTRSDVISSRRADVQSIVSSVVELNGKLKSNKGLWIDIINKLTGLDKDMAGAALENSFPDHALHRSSTIAIAKMMTELKYIARDVTGEIDKRMDYSFLEAATKQSKNELGY